MICLYIHPAYRTGKSACHVRLSENTGYVQVVNLKEISAATSVQLHVSDVNICVHLRAFAYLLRWFISYLCVPGHMLRM